jgi:hypothetical protein
VVLGDTGCRLQKSSNSYQACNDSAQYPFATVAAQAAAWKPDLVIHVGDYHYRENACPEGNAGCAGSPWGYGWDAWDEDFFAPGARLLDAAPWIMARGNHENCQRGGQGYWRFLDPRPLLKGRDCNAAADDDSGNYSDPYAVPIGQATQLLVLDTANTTWKGLKPGDTGYAKYQDLYRKLDALAPGRRATSASPTIRCWAWAPTARPTAASCCCRATPACRPASARSTRCCSRRRSRPCCPAMSTCGSRPASQRPPEPVHRRLCRHLGRHRAAAGRCRRA